MALPRDRALLGACCSSVWSRGVVLRQQRRCGCCRPRLACWRWPLTQLLAHAHVYMCALLRLLLMLLSWSHGATVGPAALVHEQKGAGIGPRQRISQHRRQCCHPSSKPLCRPQICRHQRAARLERQQRRAGALHLEPGAEQLRQRRGLVRCGPRPRHAHLQGSAQEGPGSASHLLH